MSRERLRWAGLIGLIAVVLAVVLFERYNARGLVIHPLGSTDAPYGWVERIPEGEGPRPLLVLLHGLGGVGDGRHPEELVRFLSPLSTPLGVVRIVAPQSPGQWDPERLDRFIAGLRDVDPHRIYLSGLSMGGCGAFRYAARFPERLAGVVPICAGCARTGSVARGVPIRAFHAFDDEVVPNATTAGWVAAFAGVELEPYAPGADRTAVFDGRWTWRDGKDAAPSERLSFTELATGGHGIWRSVYADDATWQWLFAQRR